MIALLLTVLALTAQPPTVGPTHAQGAIVLASVTTTGGGKRVPITPPPSGALLFFPTGTDLILVAAALD